MLEKFFNDLSTANIRYCILHGWQSLPDTLLSDLDMVISGADLQSLEKILREHTAARLVQLFQHQGSCFYFVLALREESGIRFTLVDVATDYRRNRRILFSAEELLAERRHWNGFWVASPRVEYRYLLVKKVLKGEMPEHQKMRLQGLREELGNEAVSSARYLFGKQYGDFFISCVAASDWTRLESNLSHLRRAVLWQVVKRDPFNPIRYLISEMRRVWNRCRFPTGLFVAVLGPDGAGKSTLIQTLQENLTGAFRRTDAFHLRPMIVGKKKTTGPVTDPHGKPPHPWWFSLFKIPYLLLDYELGYFLKVRPHVTRSTLVLFDRYYDDLLVDPLRYRYGGPMWFARVARKFLPKPDLYLILDVKEESVRARKAEVSPEELNRQCYSYRKLASELRNAVLLNGSLSACEVALDASELILDYLHQRYLERRALWFRDDDSETLGWLKSIMFTATQSSISVCNSQAEPLKPQRSAAGAFRWLSLKDGRGYLIPTESREARVKALDLYNAQNSKAKVAKKILGIGFKLGLSSPLLRKLQFCDGQYVSKNGGKQCSLLEHVEEILHRRDIIFGISLGTPGSHRKPVIQVLTKEGKVLGYVKVGWNAVTNALVQNEAGVSRYLSGVSLNSFSIPAVLYAGWWNDHFVCVQSSPPGKIEAPPQNLASQYLSVLNELKTLHISWRPLKESAFWQTLVHRVEEIRNSFHRRILQQGLRRAEESLCNEVLPFHFCHGDFAPWNTQILNSRPFLFDWEYADREGLPGWDLFHFTVQTLWLLRKQAPEDIHKMVINNFSGNGAKKSGFDLFNLKLDVIKSLFLLYVLDRLSFYGCHENGNFDKVRFFSTQIHLQLQG